MTFARTWKSVRSAIGYLVAAERGPGWRQQSHGDRIQSSRVETEHHAIAALLYGQVGLVRDSKPDMAIRLWATEKGVVLCGHERRVLGRLKELMINEGMLYE